MTIDLSTESEELITEADQNGVSLSASELVEAAVRQYLEALESTAKGRFRILRQKIEAPGVPLLDEQGIRQEVAERRGSWA